MIAGLLEPDSGEVLIAGTPTTSRSFAVRDDVGYVPQELAIYPELTGRENLIFFQPACTEQQAIAVGLLVGLGMAGLGGAMVPSELFSETMQRVSRITPHSWALDGFAELVGQGQASEASSPRPACCWGRRPFCSCWHPGGSAGRSLRN